MCENKKKINIIISCYNEENNINDFFQNVIEYLDFDKYYICLSFVNDGSNDNTEDNIVKLKQNFDNIQNLILQKSKKNQKNDLYDVKNVYSFNGILKTKNKFAEIKLISFTKNYGHELAMLVGIDYSDADYNIVMDVDLQHPPKKIPEIISKLEAGNDVIFMRRLSNKTAGFIKNLTSNMYYNLFNKFSKIKIEKNVSDFLAFDNTILEIIKNKYRFTPRYLRYILKCNSKNYAIIDFEADERNAGNSKYNFKKLFKLAINSFVAIKKVENENRGSL